MRKYFNDILLHMWDKMTFGEILCIMGLESHVLLISVNFSFFLTYPKISPKKVHGCI